MSQHGCPERLSDRPKAFQEEGAQPTMEVLVETLTGTAFEMTVSPSDTILTIKSKICRVEGIPVSQQHLVYNLRELEDAMSLGALGICDGARLRLVLGMRGGPISSRRLPPPAQPWTDIERLLDTNRDDGDWGCSTSGSGCRVTVVVFREGERVNMLRVRENADGSYSPAEASSHSTHNCNCGGGYDVSKIPMIRSPLLSEGPAGANALAQNAVTMGKMLELRRRMETLHIRRRPNVEKVEIQKTRSEETLSVPSLLDEPSSALDEADPFPLYASYSPASDAFTPLHHDALRYEYECVPERYELLPPVRADAARPGDAARAERLKLSDALAGSILVSGAAGAAGAGDEPLAPNLPATEYGPLVGGGWRARGFGSSSQLAPHAAPAHARSASSLHVRAPLAPRLPRSPPLSDALFSSSTSDLEHLRRQRLLPALSRHRNTEHLHLSDDQLHRPQQEVGSERRQRRIDKIAELDNSRVFRFGDCEDKEEKKEVVAEKEKKIRIRCGFCKKKLSIATVHKCRCGAEFCAPHRYAEVHGCLYDYKAAAALQLRRANPLVSAPKLPKI